MSTKKPENWVSQMHCHDCMKICKKTEMQEAWKKLLQAKIK